MTDQELLAHCERQSYTDAPEGLSTLEAMLRRRRKRLSDATIEAILECVEIVVKPLRDAHIQTLLALADAERSSAMAGAVVERRARQLIQDKPSIIWEVFGGIPGVTR